jgi:3-oxoacyl-[acyl-carrier protein] reductase
MKTYKKIALITGASSGIGFGIAHKLNQEGYKVFINSKTEKKIIAAAKKIPGSVPIVADLTCPIQADGAIKKLKTYVKQIDVLVCNVGSGSSCPPGEEKHKDWMKMFDLNFFSTTNIIESSRTFITKKTGSIICISSICGIDYIPGAPTTYSVAKASLNHYIKISARNFAKKGIRINGIAPGNILFENSVWEKKIAKNKKVVKEMVENNVALKRFGSISEVAQAVIFLASSDSDFITGSIIPVDGGQLR